MNDLPRRLGGRWALHVAAEPSGWPVPEGLRLGGPTSRTAALCCWCSVWTVPVSPCRRLACYRGTSTPSSLGAHGTTADFNGDGDGERPRFRTNRGRGRGSVPAPAEASGLRRCWPRYLAIGGIGTVHDLEQAAVAEQPRRGGADWQIRALSTHRTPLPRAPA